MTNAEIKERIKEDFDIYGAAWRSAPVFAFRRLMSEKGLRNSDIAERLGVSEANVSRMLRGDQNLKIDSLNLLAAAIGEPLIISFGDAPKEDVRDSTAFMEVFEFETFHGGMAWGRLNKLRGQVSTNEDYFSSKEVANESVFAFC